MSKVLRGLTGQADAFMACAGAPLTFGAPAPLTLGVMLYAHRARRWNYH